MKQTTGRATPRVRVIGLAALLAACSPSAPSPKPRLPVPIRGAETMSLVRGADLERLVRGSTQTRIVTGGAVPVEHFAAAGDAYALSYDRPDSTGRYRITPDRVCLRFVDERSIFCRFYLTDAAGKVWMAEDDRDYPLHIVQVAVAH